MSQENDDTHYHALVIYLREGGSEGVIAGVTGLGFPAAETTPETIEHDELMTEIESLMYSAGDSGECNDERPTIVQFDLEMSKKFLPKAVKSLNLEEHSVNYVPFKELFQEIYTLLSPHIKWESNVNLLASKIIGVVLSQLSADNQIAYTGAYACLLFK